MTGSEELRRIAQLVGISTRHVDALGVVHEPDEETLSRLIAAFGLPASPQLAAEALAEESETAPYGLATVQIVPAESPVVLHLRWPDGTPGVEWHCQFEDGSQTAGRSDGPQLHLPE